jgi:hypothetical protein
MTNGAGNGLGMLAATGGVALDNVCFSFSFSFCLLFLFISIYFPIVSLLPSPSPFVLN